MGGGTGEGEGDLFPWLLAPSHSPFSCLHGFSFSGVSYSWNHAGHSLSDQFLSLAALPVGALLLPFPGSPASSSIHVYQCLFLRDLLQAAWRLAAMAVTTAYSVYPYAQVLKEAGRERKRNQADHTEHDRPPRPPPPPQEQSSVHPMPVDLNLQDSCQTQQFGSPGRQSVWRLLLTYY